MVFLTTFLNFIENEIFKDISYVDITGADFLVELRLYKTSNMMDLQFTYKGHIEVPCDRCMEAVKMNLSGKSALAVKFGQAHHEDFDELLILDENEHEIDLGQHIYESISLLIPARTIHEEGSCDPEVMKRINSDLDLKGKQEIDPRWEKLKKFKD